MIDRSTRKTKMAMWQEIFKNKRAFWIYIPLTMLYATSYFQRTALPGTIHTQLTEELSLTATQIGNLAAAFVYPYAVFQLFSGALIDRFCGTRVVLTGGLIYLAGIFLFPVCSDIRLLYFARILTGIGASTMFLSVVRETDRLFGRKNYAVMFGIAYFCGYGGGLMGSLPFERLCGIFPWQNVLLAAAVLAGILFLIFAFGKTQVSLPPPVKTPFSLKPYCFAIRNPLSWLVILCGNITFCTYFIIQTVFGKKFLEDFAGFSSTGAAAVIFALTLVCMTTMLTTSFLTRLTGNRRRPLVIASCGLCACSSILMTAAIYCRFPGWVFAVIYCCFAAAAGIPPIFSMLMQELNSKDIIAQSCALSNMLGYLSVAIGSQLIGLLLDCFDKTAKDGITVYSPAAYQTLFIVVSVLSVISFIMSLKMPETRGHYLHLHIDQYSKS